MRTVAAEFQMLDWKTSEGFFQALPRWVRDGTRRLDESASVRFVPRNEAEDGEAEFHVDSAIAPLHVHEGGLGPSVRRWDERHHERFGPSGALGRGFAMTVIYRNGIAINLTSAEKFAVLQEDNAMRTKERKVLDAADVLCGECPVIQKDDDEACEKCVVRLICELSDGTEVDEKRCDHWRNVVLDMGDFTLPSF